MQRITFFSAILSLALLSLVGALTIGKMTARFGESSEKHLAPVWPTSLSGAVHFVDQVQDFAKTRYAFRDAFFNLGSAIKVDLLHHSETTNVLLGKDGYLFYKTDEPLRLVQGDVRLSEREKSDWIKDLTYIKNAFSEKSIQYSLVVAPNKHSIYPDKLPDWIVAAPSEKRRTADIVKLGRAVFGPGFVDATDLLLSYRKLNPQMDLYFPTDTHWTEYGAALVMHEAVTRAGISVDPPEFSLRAREFKGGGDLGRMIGRRNPSPELFPTLPGGWTCETEDGQSITNYGAHRRFTCGISDGNPSTIVVFHDSFGIGVVPYFATRFHKAYFFRNERVDPEIAASLNADLVLHIYAERRFFSGPLSDFFKWSSEE